VRLPADRELRQLSRHGPFLTAEWRHLALLNYEVDRSALAGLVPRGTELDEWQGRTYLSVVGFLFLRTRVLGLPIPFHRDFEEVNLRFYVRRKTDGGWRRGVAFVKELVPRTAVAFLARRLYNENYVAVPMEHEIKRAGADPARIESVSYRWTLAGCRSRLALSVASELAPLTAGSHAEFIAEHYWGYAAQRDGGTCEYQVQHPPWLVASAHEARLDCDVSLLYGAELGRFLQGPPASAFLADGSEVAVSHGARLDV
jgi:uncharacterized protein YqjF (DUF2071 family)